MNWSYIIIAGATGIIGLLTFLYTVLIGRKNTTIEALKETNETLKEKNTWLQEQIDLAKATSGDILTESLGKRISLLESELTRLSKDYETNKELIAVKEKELAETTELFAEVGKELGKLSGTYQELKTKYLCPTCEASLVELKDIHEIDWIGSQRKYACGFTELDGETVYYCPADPAYPRFEEFELTLQKRIVGGGYTIYMSPKTDNARMVEPKTSFGMTKEEAVENLKEEHYRNPAILDNEHPPF